MKSRLNFVSPFIFVVVSSFFTYQLYWTIKSIFFTYYITANFTDALAVRFGNSLSPSRTIGFFWYFAEVSGSIGLIVRFAGAFFMLFAVSLFLYKKNSVLSKIYKAIVLEATYYLFYIPFIFFLFVGSSFSPRYSKGVFVAISYLVQTLLVFPTMIFLSKKIKSGENNSETSILKWIAITATSFVFALWIKHMMIWVYALSQNMNSLINIIGFVNSTITLLVAAVATLLVCLPVIRKKRTQFNINAMAGILIVIGLHFVVFLIISIYDSLFFAFLPLTDIWGIAFPVLGLGLLIKPSKTGNNFKAGMLKFWIIFLKTPFVSLFGQIFDYPKVIILATKMSVGQRFSNIIYKSRLLQKRE